MALFEDSPDLTLLEAVLPALNAEYNWWMDPRLFLSRIVLMMLQVMDMLSLLLLTMWHTWSIDTMH